MDWVNLGAPGGLLFPREGTLELLPLSPLQAPFESVLVSALLVLHQLPQVALRSVEPDSPVVLISLPIFPPLLRELRT